MMSIEEAKSKAMNKRHWYDGLLRTGWYLPTYSSRICTWDFLKYAQLLTIVSSLNRFLYRDVRNNRVYCLTYATLRKKSCVSSPPQRQLNEMACESIQVLLTNPRPDLSEADQADYNRWAKLLQYLTTYEANSGKWLIQAYNCSDNC